ncbi:hypothetical protein [Streptomyces sp. NPDC059816]|uniref:hypothetical protein n=1 Tax=Streptomyces sp. NPDC059816 TaxID=3346960 RepID=UPI00365788B0
MRALPLDASVLDGLGLSGFAVRAHDPAPLVPHEPAQDTVSQDLTGLMRNMPPEEVSRRLEHLRGQQRQRITDHPAPALPRARPSARDQQQEQAAAHQQRPQAPGLS